jgi:predicted dehydrogenase
MEAMWTRFLPSTEKLLEIIRSKELGNIQNVKIDFGFKTTYDKASRLFNPELGGGALLDIGIYPLFISYLLFGKSDNFQSKVKFSPSGVDMDSEITLHYETFTIEIRISFINDFKPNRLEIIGDKDSLISENFWMSESLELLRSQKKYRYPFESNGYEYELKECVQVISKNEIESLIWRHKDTLGVLKWMDEIRDTWGFKYPIEIECE